MISISYIDEFALQCSLVPFTLVYSDQLKDQEILFYLYGNPYETSFEYARINQDASQIKLEGLDEFIVFPLGNYGSCSYIPTNGTFIQIYM